MLGALRLMRPVNCLMMGVAVLVGALIASRGALIDTAAITLSLGFVTGFALTAASMVLNDYVDREIDAVNAPKRPIPSGVVSPSGALALSFTLSLAGFIAAFFTGMLSLLTALFAWVLFTAYTVFGKHTGFFGNILVSGCVSTPFFYGAVLLGQVQELNVILYAAMAFLSNMGREVTKGIADVLGDRGYGVRTVAVVYGEKTAAAVSTGFYSAAVVLSLLPWFLRFASPFYLLVVALADAGFIASSLSLIRKPTRENSLKVKKQVLFWMLLSLIAFIIGSIS